MCKSRNIRPLRSVQLNQALNRIPSPLGIQLTEGSATLWRCARTRSNSVPAFPCGLPVRKWQPLLASGDRLRFIYDYYCSTVIKRKMQVQLAEVAPMARRQDKLLEESEAVRPQKKKNLSLNKSNFSFLMQLFGDSPSYSHTTYCTTSILDEKCRTIQQFAI